MSDKSFSSREKKCRVPLPGLLIMMLLICFSTLTTDVLARSKYRGRVKTEKVKVLKKYQQKLIATKLVNTLIKHDFFKNVELPRKMALAEMQLSGNDLGLDPDQFTDLVLNRLLANPQIMVINQELKPDLSMDYQLMFYMSNELTRKKGILLGADYYITGYLRSDPDISTNGKTHRAYRAGLSLRNIRTNKLLAEVSYDFKKKKEKKQKLKYR